MTDVIHLDLPSTQIEIRDEEKREIFGRIIPYGEQITIRGRPESFAMGAVQDVQPLNVKLLPHHDQKTPVGRMMSLEERDDGAYASFIISKTQQGDELLQLVKDGVLDSFSPGFIPGEQDKAGVHRRVKALPEVSLVTFPAYESAKVLAVRQEEKTEMEVETKEERVLSEEDFLSWEKRMEDVQARLDSIVQASQAPDPEIQKRVRELTPLHWFAARVDADINHNGGRLERMEESFHDLLQSRALDDVTGVYPEPDPATDASGLVVQEFIASLLVDTVDRRRPLFSNLGSFPMPRSGYAKIPVWTQHTEVAARPTQKAEAASRKPIITGASFEAEWYSGAVDIALELVRTSEMSVLEIIWNDLLGQYAVVTEAAAVTFLDTGGQGFTYTGTALATNTYAAFIAAVLAAADTVEDNSGAPATKLFVTRAQFNALVGLINPTVFTATGDGAGSTVDLTAQSFVIPGSGIQVIKTKNLDQAVLTNGDALKVSDGGPERVEAINVALMGQDLGLLGRTMIVPRIPSAVVVFGTEPS